LLILPSLASAGPLTFYESRSTWAAATPDPATASRVTLNFEGLAPAGGTFLAPSGLQTSTGVTIGSGSGGGGVGIVDAMYQPSRTNWGSGASLTGGPAGIGVSNPNGFSFVGMDLGAWHVDGTYGGMFRLDAYDLSMTLIAQETVMTPAAQTRTFLGFVSDVPIGYIGISSLDSNEWILDNLTYNGSGALLVPPDGITVNPPAPPEDPLTLPCDFGILRFCHAPSGSKIDPDIASGYTYTMLGDSLFTSILEFPTGFGAPFTVSTGGTVLGSFSPGQAVDFEGGGVREFTVSGITPGVDVGDATAFPLRLAFNTPTADLTMTPIGVQTDPAPVPEPASLVLLGSGALSLVLSRVRPRRPGRRSSARSV